MAYNRSMKATHGFIKLAQDPQNQQSVIEHCPLIPLMDQQSTEQSAKLAEGY